MSKQEVGWLGERGRCSLRCSMRRHVESGMQFDGRNCGRLWRGRLVKGESRDGRASCVDMGKLGS